MGKFDLNSLNKNKGGGAFNGETKNMDETKRVIYMFERE